jgi:Na+-transporting NADH:ubiquinone oxidoreductase subunit NqrF
MQISFLTKNNISMQKTILLFCSVMLVAFIGCNKKANKAPELTITSPSEGQSFLLGSTVPITGTATDDNALHECAIAVTNHMGDTVYSNYPTVHAQQSFVLNYSFTATDTGPHHLSVLFVDHEEAQVSKEVMFTIQ